MVNFLNNNRDEYDAYSSPHGRQRQRFANALLNNATKTEPVYGWGQALAKVLEGGTAGYLMGKNAKEQDDNLKSAPGELANILNRSADQWTNPDSGEKVGPGKYENASALAGQSDNPYIQQVGAQIGLKGIEDNMNTGNKLKLLEAKYGKSSGLMPLPSQDESSISGGPQLTGDPVVDAAAKKSFGTAQGKAEQAVPGQAASKDTLDNIFSKMSDRFNKLDSLGGTPGHGTLSYLSNTEGVDLPFGLKTIGGQDIARMRGTPEQTIREELQGDIGDVKSAYQKASGLTSKQLDSNQEMQQFMRSLPNLLKQNKSNQARIADMSERFANSVAKAKIEAQGQGDGPIAPDAAVGQDDIPDAHIQALKANPDKAPDFDAKYGPGSSAKILGQPQSNVAPIDGPLPAIDVQGQGGPIEEPVPNPTALNNPKITEATSPINIQAFRQSLIDKGQSPASVDAYLKSRGLI